MIWLWLSVAGAYTLSGNSWTWHDQPVEEPFHIATDSFPSEFAREDLLAAHAEAMRVWNVQGGADLQLRSEGHTTVTQYGSGNNDWNNVAWHDFRWGSTLGIAARTVVGDEIRDCDIQIVAANNSGATNWSLKPEGAGPGENDMRHTLIHEMGHCIGIDHSNVSAALMGPYAPDDQGPSSRVLQPDDIAAVQAVYGTAAPMMVVADVQTTPEAGGVALSITVENLGDGVAWGVLGDLDGGDPALVELSGWAGELGDIQPGGSAGSAGDALQGTLIFAEDCVGEQEVQLELLLSDEAGNLWEDPIQVALSCPEGRLSRGGGDEAGAGLGCGCSAGGGTPAGSGGFLLIGLLASLRRNRSGLTRR